MMMSFGTFVFSLSTLAYQELQRQQSWRFGASERMGARAALQYLGEGEDTIDLSGVLAPELTGSRDSLDTLRELARDGQALPLVDGAGVVHGNFVLTGLRETHSVFFSDGTPRRIEFAIALRREDSTVQPETAA
ncbi:phage tail protein [Xanthomonas translucens]|uniref:phage tail protein n=1 Tax=Xanthomonas campestris pv. translucens TaxID=343 RepID=UPI00071E79C6|nr:phage tail protein [Xanthomonas translucens]KTF40686.1 oxidoreductase [Xanthomonas translucens pv. translucens]QSQ38918.1 phage tail protein [Xanthomonas translucens pv. translucens]UII65645.1 phage tail protein [Xanthomonas translucens]